MHRRYANCDLRMHREWSVSMHRHHDADAIRYHIVAMLACNLTFCVYTPSSD